ncbi:hypothetical protein M413DRAFT_360610 [Hebeloma cylindrosporum]|uniref:Uncharacterized protein n=1 Tax=Hebeloma cylindrosporum TaxID=76867 RepID=A0A0C3CLS7_HEBCY|nr:hypothetical protein M413DRAFT_360610 [Hebeloma cylindrosporum h7]
MHLSIPRNVLQKYTGAGVSWVNDGTFKGNIASVRSLNTGHCRLPRLGHTRRATAHGTVQRPYWVPNGESSLPILLEAARKMSTERYSEWKSDDTGGAAESFLFASYPPWATQSPL